MGFWFFMLAMGLLFPVVMILFGTMFMKSAPKKINYIFGYRTDMSMKNRKSGSLPISILASCGSDWAFCLSRLQSYQCCF